MNMSWIRAGCMDVVAGWKLNGRWMRSERDLEGIWVEAG